MDELKGLTDQELAEIKIGQPYDGKGSAFALDKHVHYPQFADELVKVLPDAVSFVAQGDLSGEDVFLTLHFSHPDVDFNKVREVADAHVVNLDHGLSEAQVAYNDLLKRLAQDDLAVKDLNALLRLHFADKLQ